LNHAAGEGGRLGSRALDIRLPGLAVLAILAVFAAYSNHFHNSFHFDDSHAVVTNVYIRDLRNLGKFFTDARTFSSLPANQTWRPLVSASLALDYHLGGGLAPLWFHVSTFFWFLAQLVLMFLLYRSILDAARPQPSNRYVALAAAACYGLHPANAETVNYIVQRGDIYSTLAVVAGLATYIRAPRLRKFGIYILPVILGAMAKPPAVVFGGILLAYIFLFEEEADRRRFWPALRKAAPALLVCTLLAMASVKLTPKNYVPSTMPAWAYWSTQPWAVLRYVRSFFLPLWLSADTDLSPFRNFSDARALTGTAFCLALLLIAYRTARRRTCRPISFGILWFFFALAPTSIFVLSEVENDHRMFFPFVGLILAAACAATLVWSRLIAQGAGRQQMKMRTAQGAVLCLLIALGFGTWKRNEVWRSEESLWRDVTLKSPENGRGLMNYGLTLLGKGDAPAALAYFQRAAVFTPNYYLLEINTGIAHGVLGHPAESEAHFRRAIQLQPGEAQPYFYYGRWLASQGRTNECIQAEKTAIQLNPALVEARHVLMQAYLEQAQAAALRELAKDTLQLAPNDPATLAYLARSENQAAWTANAEQVAESQPTPEAYLALSLLYYRGGRYQDCIKAARRALQLRPNYAEAYNNIAAAHQAMSQWDAAIGAAQQALRLNPGLALARNNLAWSLAQKELNRR
jgi:tetratricopeptide (TPR) repeat protein